MDEPAFLHEVWALLGFAVLVTAIRLGVRVRLVGFRGLKGDDFFALLGLLGYTLDAMAVTVAYLNGTTADYPRAVLAAFDGQDEANVSFGTKIHFASW